MLKALTDTLFVALLWTNPCNTALQVDTTAYYCDGGSPLTNLDSLFVYGASVNGGGFVRVAALDGRGKECQPDSVHLALAGWVGGHFYVLSHNPGGLSCQSNTVYKGTVTGVPNNPSNPNPVRVDKVYWFNVQGRRVPGHKLERPDEPYAMGVYFRRIGEKGKAKKVVLLK